MVKLDNWQTKAEKAALRRIQSKQLKTQKQTTRQNKLAAQTFMAFLQEHNDAIVQSSTSPEIRIDIWADAKSAKEQQQEQQQQQQVTTIGEGRPRSSSHSLAPDNDPYYLKDRKGRVRSNSDAMAYASFNQRNATGGGGSDGKKNGRTRSGSMNACSDGSSSLGHDDSESFERSVAPRMCLKYFFGTCSATLTLSNGSRNRRKSPSKNCGGSSGAGVVVNCCEHGWHRLANRTGDSFISSSPLKHKDNQHNIDDKTLASILLHNEGSDRFETNQKSLQMALQSITSHFATTDDDTTNVPTSMDSKSHHSVLFSCHGTEKDTDVRLADVISRALSQYGCSISSITYVVMQGILVFDRYQGGLCLSSAEQEVLLFGGSRRRSVSIGEYNERRSRSLSVHVEPERSNIDSSSRSEEVIHSRTDTDIHSLHQHLVQYLPGQVLEYILKFLPVSATAILPQVCKAWNKEIGRSSPELWRHLLESHEWPCMVEFTDQSCVEETTKKYRDAFVAHYTARRDVLALKEGLELHFDRASADSSRCGKDVASFDFKDTIGQPILGQPLVEFWSDTRILVGSSRDRTLHLYDVIDSSTGNGKRCKQSVRVSIPFANSRRKSYELTAMKLDTSSIGCLFCSGDLWNLDQDIWLVVVQKEDLLCAGKGGNHVSELERHARSAFQLQETILEYMSSSSDIDTELHQWLDDRCLLHEDGVDREALKIYIADDRLVACGDGNFLMEVYISVVPKPGDLEDDDYELPPEPRVIGKIVLFNSSLGRIQWVSPQSCFVEVASLFGGGGPIEFGGVTAMFLTSMEEAVGIVVKGPDCIQCSSISLPRFRYGLTHLAAAMTSAEVVLTQEYYSRLFFPGDTQETVVRKAILHLVNRENGSSCLFDGFPNGCLLAQVIQLREDYLIVLCRSEDTLVNNQDQQNANLRLLHIPSRKTTFQANIEKSISRENIPVSMTCDGGLIAVGVQGSGIFLAGHSVSHTCNETWTNKKSKKKKWTRGKGKRDGFCRGMRQSMGG